MYKSKLLSLLKKIKKNPREILEFEKFVSSPYFNTNTEVTDLFFYLKKHLNASEKQQKIKLNKELVFKKVFSKKKKYVDWKFNECISNLSLLVEQFFVFQELKKNKRRMNILLADGLKNRGIDQYYFKKVNAIENVIKGKQAVRDSTFHGDLAWLNEHLYFHLNYKKEDTRLIAMCDHLDHYYLMKKLNFICEVLSRKLISDFDYNPSLFDEVLRYSREHFKDDPVITAYLSIIELFQTKEVKAVPRVKQQLFKLIKQYKFDCRHDLLIYFINAIPEIKNRLQLYFEIYQLADREKLLIEGSYLSPDHFTNIIHIGCLLGEDDWIKEFKAANTKFLKLDQDNLENIDQLFDAYINFYKKNYVDAFGILQKIKLKDMTYGLRRYTLILCTLIEEKEKIKSEFKVDFVTICSNFSAYNYQKYKKGEISISLKNGCQIFINAVKKLYYPTFREDKGPILELINSNDEVPFKEWLKCKVEVLLG